MSPHDVVRQPPGCRTGIAKPGSRTPRAGLALTKCGTPRAFHGLDLRARSQGQRNRRTTMTEGPAGAFRPSHARSTLPRRERPSTPFRVKSLHRRSTLRLVGPCGLSLDTASRCLETASTTDVHVTSTRSKHHLRRPPADRRGKPAGARLRDRSRGEASPPGGPRTAPDHLAVIRPPTASRSTARRRLRVDRLPRSRMRGWGEKRRRFIGCRRSVDSNPVTPLVGARIKGRRSDLVPDT